MDTLFEFVSEQVAQNCGEQYCTSVLDSLDLGFYLGIDLPHFEIPVNEDGSEPSSQVLFLFAALKLG